MKWLVLFLALVSQAALPMGWWDAKEPLKGFDLSPTELKQLSIQSGWSSDDPELMMFEVSNRLSGPIYCVGASFEMKDGRSTFLRDKKEMPLSEALKKRT